MWNLKLLKMTLASVLTGVLLIAASGCKLKQIPCGWAGEEIRVDGRIADWQGLPVYYDDHQQVSLAISNDSANMYLFLRSPDPSVMRAIRTAGITLWLNAERKKDKKLGFHYRGGPPADALMQAGLLDTAAQERPHPDSSRRRFRPGMFPAGAQFQVIDKRLALEEDIPVDGSQGPAVVASVDQGTFVYEFRIPLQDHLVDFYGFDANPGMEIVVGAEWGGRPNMSRDFDNSGTPPDDITGGIDLGIDLPTGGGGGRGGMRRGAGMFDKKDVWIYTVLAVPTAPGL